ncbi:diaminopimelate epimerase [Clostridium estertheticum]|uniref:diaminopimelate epimerase n=1 Tax=Clostridium estertheticum TaxID=238834 RepID=UPI001C6F217F|nr:diaminopimelate epimerase [Clostridium estertheticum]MBW9170713.1 diaminopimelate epimerase [Clostridium estertheticum]WLC77482.1 diaminopimelate epimerase [Clostridium estertheticum]
MNFTKMQGTGNDFIVIEDLEEKYNDLGVLSKKLCDRHYGIGADGILVVRKSTIADIQMIIINADGSYASMCGNGIRCFAKYIFEKKYVLSENIKIETGDGVKLASICVCDGEFKGVTINMGKYNFNPISIPALSSSEIINKKLDTNNKDYYITSLLMGVPHTIVFGKLEDYEVCEGKVIENNSLFPQKTNVNFCEVVDKNRIRVKTWERGAGPTLACGTGSCAAVVAASRLGYTEGKVEVQVPGGILNIEIIKGEALMEGPAETVFKGQFLTT